MRGKISGVGSYLPEKKLTNHDLEALVDTSDEWIRARTGIECRSIAAEGEFTSDLLSESNASSAMDAPGH